MTGIKFFFSIFFLGKHFFWALKCVFGPRRWSLEADLEADP